MVGMKANSEERISQRRGLGLLTIRPQQLTFGHMDDDKSQQLPGKSIADGSGRRRDGAVISCEGIRRREETVATVQELRRDQPFDSSEESPSPSSKFRASLPGSSPRPPFELPGGRWQSYHHHHHHHGFSIFSFPSSALFPNSSSSSSHQRRRRPFYPPLFARARWLAAASYRLPAVAEKSVGNASVTQLDQEEQLFHKRCVVPIDDYQDVRCHQSQYESPASFSQSLGRTALPVLNRPLELPTAYLPSLPSAEQRPQTSLDKQKQEQEYSAGPILAGRREACELDAPIGQPGATGTAVQHTVAVTNKTESLPLAWTTGGQHQREWFSGCDGVLAENRPAHHQQVCCCSAKRTSSFLPFCGPVGERPATCVSDGDRLDLSTLSASLSVAGNRRATKVIVHAGSSADAERWDSKALLQDPDDDDECSSCACRSRPPLDYFPGSWIMDRHKHSSTFAPPLAMASASTTINQDDATGNSHPSSSRVAATLSSSAPLSRHLSCHHREVANKKANCGTSCQCDTSSAALSASFCLHHGNATGATTTSTATAGHFTDGIISQPATATLITKTTTTTTSSHPMCISSQSSSCSSSAQPEHLCCATCPPDRPARRSRSPKELSSADVQSRDRRAFSVDRPVVLSTSISIPTTASGSATISAASRAKTRSVDRLRQLTQRLRPSTASTSVQKSVAPVVEPAEHRLPPLPSASQMVGPSGPTGSSVNCQLPPIPVAPPRHPDRRSSARSERRVKKDSATSTSDLASRTAIPPQPASASLLSENERELVAASDGASELASESDAKNSNIVRKKTDEKKRAATAGSSAEVTRPSQSLFWSPPPSETGISPPLANDVGGQRGSSLFATHSPRDSTSATVGGASKGAGDDLFDDLHVSKLNPRILVGTYTQRTIPFRSASFSQIDHAGGDGTYSRRPRTSIMLKPITPFSAGRAEIPSPLPSSSASLPRRFNSSGDVLPLSGGSTNSQPLTELSEEQPPSTSKRVLWKGPSTSSEDLDAESDVAGIRDGNTPPPTKESQPSTNTLVNDSVSVDSESVKPAVNGDQPTRMSDSDSTAADSQVADKCVTPVDPEITSLGNSQPVDYETSEVSVTAQIPWHSQTSVSNLPESGVSGPDAASSTSSSLKALPVLDLLELSNHLLRLKAACCSSREDSGESIIALDHLTDLEVTPEFCIKEGLTCNIPSQEPSVASGGDDSGLMVLTKQNSESELQPRPSSWLNELLRLTNGGSNSSLSDEGCVADSHEYSNSNPIDSGLVPAVTDAPSENGIQETYGPALNDALSQESSCAAAIQVSNSPSTANSTNVAPAQMERTDSGTRRRRSSSLVLAGSSSTLTVDSGLCTKSNSTRSLHSFPPSGTKSDLVVATAGAGASSSVTATDTDPSIPPAGNRLSDSSSVSRDTFVIDAAEASPAVAPKVGGVEDPTNSCAADKEFPSITTSNLDDDVASSAVTPGRLLVIGSSQRTSTGSDEQDDDDSISAKVDDQDVTRAKSTSHRLTVSVNLTLVDEPIPSSTSGGSTYRNSTPSPFSPDMLIDGLGNTSSGCFSPSTEKIQQKSPLGTRRYGLKRRPLRGPYGEMLEAEMNKSEFGKMYSSSGASSSQAKRNTAEDLGFLLREPITRINREAKSSSPRPLSPSSIPASGMSSMQTSGITYNVRQNSLPLPTCHSLDDSQLKVGYNSGSSNANSMLPSVLAGSASASSGRIVLPKRKISANIPYVFSDCDLDSSAKTTVSMPISCVRTPTTLVSATNTQLNTSGAVASPPPPPSSHQRTSSSPCQLIQFTTEAGFTSEDEPELLEPTSLTSALSRTTARLLETSGPHQQETVGGGSGCVSGPEQRHTLPLTRGGSAKRHRDTRTHAIGELYDTERSYVESLQILVTKYLQPLKSPECAGLVESTLVDEIFYQIPAILAHHEAFLEELRKRLESWDSKQCVGGVFLEALTKPSVIETYTAYINHWKHAKEAVKSACMAKSAFSKFLEAMAREHKGKLALDSLLIMPVQRIPRYELLIKMLLKHTARDHPDHGLLLEAQKEVHELAVKINCVEREAYGAEQQQATLRELESLVEGLGPGNLATPERTFIRHDCVTIPSALGTRKERGLFLFSDLLVITSVKRRGNAIRKSSSYSTSGIASTLEANKFKLLMRVPLDDLEMTKGKDEGSRRSTKDLEHLEEDLAVLNQMTELISSLHISHPTLDEAIKEVQHSLQRQLSEKQNSLEAPQLATIDLAISTQDGTETLSVAFTSSEKRASWEESFIETKLKLRAMSPDRRPPPEFLSPLPIRKTRAGLQFTCAAPTVSWNSQHLRDVWVCNSDGYVGQVCILSLHPEPNVASCNGVCNARITCIAAVPASPSPSDESCSSATGCKANESKMDASPERPLGARDSIKSASVLNNFELESSESSSESSEGEESGDEESAVCPVQFNRVRSDSVPAEMPSGPSEENDAASAGQATMWLGTEDGCIHIYHCGENIRLKKNRIRIQQGAAVLSIVYVENRVFASLANGDVVVYFREPSGTWNINEPQCITIGTIVSPVTRMLCVNNALWCATQNMVRILDITSLCVQDQFAVSSDSQRSVLSMTSNGLGVWVAMQGSAVIRFFHGLTHECICDVNLAPAVNKMLSGCDDIIRQHKAACLRVTSMLVCHDLVWVGTSAGVILTIPTPHLTPISSRLSTPPVVTGIPHGHTGHVRFLTCVEATPEPATRSSRSHLMTAHHRFSLKGKETLASVLNSPAAGSATNSSAVGGVVSTTGSGHHGSPARFFVISGGDGYEDFRHTGFSDSVGREDSTNHLLLWQA